MTLALDDVFGGYGDTLVHRNLSMDLRAGKVTTIVGRNGTGKTTLARLIVGELPLAGGSVRLDGVEIGHVSAHARARLGITSMPQTGMVFDTLTVRENLSIPAHPPKDIDRLLHIFPRLQERLSQPAGTLSGGERKILGFARAMLGKSRVLVLDEPSEGVQPENIRKMQDLIDGKRKDGTAVLLLEQNISMIVSLADQVRALNTRGVGAALEGSDISREAILEVLSI